MLQVIAGWRLLDQTVAAQAQMCRSKAAAGCRWCGYGGAGIRRQRVTKGGLSGDAPIICAIYGGSEQVARAVKLRFTVCAKKVVALTLWGGRRQHEACL